MDFAFYNEIGSRSLGGLLIKPYRRCLRFLLRPMLFKLRDLLQFMFDKHREDREMIAALQQQVAALQALVAAMRPAAIESAGVSKRLAVVEDAVLRALNDRAA